MSFGITSEYDDRLMACPFCHKPAWITHVEFDDGDVWYRPGCSECKCGWQENYPTKDEAVVAWNEHLNNNKSTGVKYDLDFDASELEALEALLLSNPCDSVCALPDMVKSATDCTDCRLTEAINSIEEKVERAKYV